MKKDKVFESCDRKHDINSMWIYNSVIRSKIRSLELIFKYVKHFF